MRSPSAHGHSPVLALALALVASGAQGGCKEQEAPEPPPAASSSAPAGDQAAAPPGAPPPTPPPAKAVDPTPDEGALSELTQLTFGARVDAPRALPAAWSGAAGVAFLEHAKSGCPSLKAVDLEGRPLELPLQEPRGGEFAVDARAWILSGPSAGSKSCGAGKGMRRLLPESELELRPEKGEARVFAAEGFQGFPDLSPDGSMVVFVGTSKDGDPELWLQARDAEAAARRLTRATGMDARPRFSPDGTRIYWSASRPQGKAQQDDWARFAHDGSVAPLPSEIWWLPIEGGEGQRLTRLLANSFAPVPVEGGVLFTSNAQDPKRADFDLYFLAEGSSEPERLTFAEGFDGLATPLPDGRIAFVSQRSGGEAQLFVARFALGKG